MTVRAAKATVPRCEARRLVAALSKAGEQLETAALTEIVLKRQPLLSQAEGSYLRGLIRWPSAIHRAQ